MYIYNFIMRKYLFLPLFLLISLYIQAQNTVYVKASADNDNGDGTTWATAKKTLAAAMTMVGSNGTVFMQAGEYIITEEVTIPANVVVMGGYETTSMGADTSHRNLPGVNSHWQDASYCTIIKGDGTFRIATVKGQLDGCVVRNGYSSTMGGGLLIDGGTARYCVIMGCDAIDDEEAAAEGGGVYIRNSGTLINCVVTECRGDNGSAVSGEDGSLINNTITRNWPSQCGTVKDFDQNVYHTVRLGNQCWMRENLRTKHYADGTQISTNSGTNSTVPYYYQNNSLDVTQYGLFYNWTAIMNGAEQTNANPSGVQGICPNGWHVPSRAEWDELINYVSSISSYCCNGVAGDVGKAITSRTGWYNNYSSNSCTPSRNQLKNNATHFNAMPAGYYTGSYSGSSYHAVFACTTNGNSSGYLSTMWLNLDWTAPHWENYYNKYYAFSVRCVLDEE